MSKTYQDYLAEDTEFPAAIKLIKNIRYPDPQQLMDHLQIGYARAMRLCLAIDEYYKDRNYFGEDSIVFDTAVKQIGDRFYDAKGNSVLISPSSALYDLLQHQVNDLGGEILGCP